MPLTAASVKTMRCLGICPAIWRTSKKALWVTPSLWGAKPGNLLAAPYRDRSEERRVGKVCRTRSSRRLHVKMITAQDVSRSKRRTEKHTKQKMVLHDRTRRL